ncbi:MAG: hypothetical protein FJ271_15030 [Planctomycetes bacterium]|nr:hypothetical protein [Planctomycetota bacterium]
MAMVCPACNGRFEQSLECPTCKVRLEYRTEAELSARQGQWQQTPWGRLLAGLLLAQGLAHGLKQLVNAVLMASDGDAEGWQTTAGAICLFAFQGLGLLIGGAVAGAGQNRAWLFGSLLGVMNALIFFVFPMTSYALDSESKLYASLVLNPALGALGALLGALIWRPLPAIKTTNFPTQAQAKIPTPAMPIWSGPISWPRVMLGMTLIVAGSVWTPRIMAWILEMGQGTLEVRTHLQSWLLQWEISALVTLIGAAAAGACTFNGLKQGLVAGLTAAVVLIGVNLGNPRSSFETMSLMLGGLVCLTGAGGWFGSQLLPPLAQRRKRRSYGLA